MKKAFSLLEIIVVIVILAILSGIGMQVVQFANDNERRVAILNELEIKSQVAIDFMTKHVDSSIKNSLRLKKLEDTECIKSDLDCVFLYNLEENFSDFKVFEWARVANSDKRKGYWDGINETRKVFETIKAFNEKKENSCYVEQSGKKYFICFALKDTLGEANYKSLLKPIVDGKLSGAKKSVSYGLYFLGDNIANTNTFLERDLYDFTITDDAKGGKSMVELKDRRNFTISNVYVLVDNIEGLIYDKERKVIRFYSYEWEARDKVGFTLSKTGKKAYPLVDDVESFSVSNHAGVTRIKLCLEKSDLPGSFINKSTTIKVCKTGVVI